MTIKNILEKYLGTSKHKNENQLLFYCPFCKFRKKKFSINLEDSIYHCWVCDKSGTIYDLLKDRETDKEILKSLRSKKKIIAKQNDDNEIKIEFPNGFKQILEESNTDTNREKYYNYCLSRGLNKFLIRHYKLGYCENKQFKDYLLIPSFDKNKNLNYLQGRYIYDDKHIIKYKNISAKFSTTIPFEYYVRWDKPIILVEGFFDMNFDFNCLPLIGSAIKKSKNYNHSKLIKKFIECNTPEVYIMLDSDAIKKSLKLAQELISIDIPTKLVNINPFNQPEELNSYWFEYFLNNAVSLNHDDIFRLMIS